jgi:hypothetical protein
MEWLEEVDFSHLLKPFPVQRPTTLTTPPPIQNNAASLPMMRSFFNSFVAPQQSVENPNQFRYVQKGANQTQASPVNWMLQQKLDRDNAAFLQGVNKNVANAGADSAASQLYLNILKKQGKLPTNYQTPDQQFNSWMKINNF